MIRKLIAAASLAAVAILTTAPATWAAPAPTAHVTIQKHRDGSLIPNSTIRKCVATTYRAKVWHTHKTRPGELCLWLGGWYPASWRVLDVDAYYLGAYFPIMQAPPRGGWKGHKPADPSWWDRATAISTS